MSSESRLRSTTTSLAGEGLMQSPAEWEIRNATLSQTLCDLVNAHRTPNATTALDIGAQHGALMDRYAELTGLGWTGVDPIFREERRSPRGARLLPGTADALPFEDQSFDVAMFANVFEHIAPHTRVESLLEMRRVLKPGAVIVGQIPNPYFIVENHSRLPLMGYLPYAIQKKYWRLSRVPWDHDFFVVTPRHIRLNASRAGFDVTLVRRFNYPLDVIPEHVRPIARLIDRPTRRLMPWAWQFVLARRKDTPARPDAGHNLSSYGERFVKGLTPDARDCGGHRVGREGRQAWPGYFWVRDARSDSYTRFVSPQDRVSS